MWTPYCTSMLSGADLEGGGDWPPSASPPPILRPTFLPKSRLGRPPHTNLGFAPDYTISICLSQDLRFTFVTEACNIYICIHSNMPATKRYIIYPVNILQKSLKLFKRLCRLMPIRCRISIYLVHVCAVHLVCL